MNRRPQGLEASKAVIGFLQYKGAEGLAPVTVAGYERDLKLWIDHMGGIDVVRITPSSDPSIRGSSSIGASPRLVTLIVR